MVGLCEVMLSLTEGEVTGLLHLGGSDGRPGRFLQQWRSLAATWPPVQVQVQVPVLVLVSVPVVSCPKHAPEDLLVQPGLAAVCHVTQQASQSAARSPPPPENPGEQIGKKVMLC